MDQAQMEQICRWLAGDGNEELHQERNRFDHHERGEQCLKTLLRNVVHGKRKADGGFKLTIRQTKTSYSNRPSLTWQEFP